jgi:hypothetical protein
MVSSIDKIMGIARMEKAVAPSTRKSAHLVEA